MASILIVPKKTIPGKKNLPVRTRYHVRWERGRGVPVVHLGVFDTETLAKRRVRSAHDQLARGEIPTADPLAATPAQSRTMSDVAERWLASRIDIAESTRLGHKNSIAHIVKRFGADDPDTLTVDDVQDWITAMSTAGVKPGTIRNRRTALKLILRHARVSPNPAADDEIRLPRGGSKRLRLPTIRELDAIITALEGMSDGKYVGVVRLMEHAGLRVHEAVAVRHEHWDRRKKRLLIPDSKTAAGTRFVEQLDGLPVMPPPGVGRVWNITSDGVQAAMRTACERAGVRAYSPHDLRHLAASRMLHQGVLSPAEIAARLGHSSPQITLSVYAHVVPPEDE